MATIEASRFCCYYPACRSHYSQGDNCQRHFHRKHEETYDQAGFDYTQIVKRTPNEAAVWASRKISWFETLMSFPTSVMEDAGASGRGHRQKIPTDKVKELVTSKLDKNEDEKLVMLPTYIAANDPKFLLDQRELVKIYDHTKTGADGVRTDFFTLGTHIESREKRFYIRAKRDPDTFYFHATEAAPHHARLSDENHPQCQVDGIRNTFTKDMLGKTGESGNYTTRANVFAREGQFFFESKVISMHPPGREGRDRALAETQAQDRTSTSRGGLRVGFCRREHHWSENLGGNAYSYAVILRCGTGLEYGNVRFSNAMINMTGEGGKDPGDLVNGDVVGLMITLPSLEVQKKVADGTFNSADYPELKCGPGTDKSRKPAVGKKMTKATAKGKEKEVDGLKAGEETTKTPFREIIRSAVNAEAGLTTPASLDIIRDRNPFLHKGMTYFECPEYTPNPDLSRPTLSAKNKSINPETGQKYNIFNDPHPNHEHPHLRTLPGSKIEMWVNGKYHGVVMEHLFAFLPPASTIEKSTKTSVVSGDIDDGLLGYYPAISHYTGGAVMCKFDSPWWFGYENDGPARPDCRPFGVRYKEQIVEDLVNDIVDEIYQEQTYKNPHWMKMRVLNTVEKSASQTG